MARQMRAIEEQEERELAFISKYRISQTINPFNELSKV